MYQLSKRSEDKLKDVHPDLVKVVRRALEISTCDFTVIEGLRSADRQRQLVAQGKSQTQNSRHLTGHAVDCVPWVNAAIPWNDRAPFQAVANAMLAAAAELNIPILWGGDWNQNGRSDDESFYDGPHFELTRSAYP